MFGMMVDDAYGSTGSSVYEAPGGKVWGGHAQVIIGYSSILDAFHVRNSWGTLWGDEGYGWIDANYMSIAAYDPWVIQVAPAVQ